ncbi:hypothetical protein MNBD_GAMMA03-92 [hydrothermal vent metagenome]|uniref:Type II secretion system protein GspH n=1 Tax=hydrothermal vent metagenome TaxID=652676 RepID=A0A3B0WBL7_9ZZZZ
MMKMLRTQHQKGFTLIELMVVVVIVSVVTSISILSLGASDQNKLTAQQNQLKTLLVLVRDQSTFDRKLYLVVPEKTGLTTHVFIENKWKESPKIEFLAWQPGLTASWEVDEAFAQQQQLPEAGWMFWPTGDVLEGTVVFSVGKDDGSIASEKENTAKVAWNDMLQFDADTEDMLDETP